MMFSKSSVLALALSLIVAMPLSSIAGSSTTSGTKKEKKEITAEAVVGSPAPEFTAKDADGKTHKLSDYKGKSYVVLEWYNQECPFVRKHYDSGNMQKLQKTYTGKGVVWFQVDSSAKGKEGYMTPAQAKAQFTKEKSAATGTLLDPSGKVGLLYGAKTTPHMYVINKEGILIYAGAIDNKPTTDEEDLKTATNYVSTALDLAMAGQAVSVASTKSYGCNVKYQ